jgi:hypothetical protein
MNFTKHFLIIGLLSVHIVALTQDRPVLDSSYLVTEYNEFINAISPPRESLFSVYIATGFNFTKGIPKIQFSSPDPSSLSGKKYTSESGFQAVVGVFIPLLKKLDVGLGIRYGVAKYSIQDKLIQSFGISYKLKESMTLLSFPFSVK